MFPVTTAKSWPIYIHRVTVTLQVWELSVVHSIVVTYLNFHVWLISLVVISIQKSISKLLCRHIK